MYVCMYMLKFQTENRVQAIFLNPLLYIYRYRIYIEMAANGTNRELKQITEVCFPWSANDKR